MKVLFTYTQDRLSDWLGELRPLTPQNLPSPVTSERHRQYLEMAEITSSSSLNTTESAATQEITQTDTSTTKRKVGEMSYLENLRFRGVSRESSHDDKLQELGFDKIMNNLSSWIDFQNLTSLIKLLESYTKKLKKGMKEQALENAFYDYDALRQDVCDWRPVSSEHRRFAPMPSSHFDWDKKFCSHVGSSEADFHRTLMPSIIDRYDFQNMFTCTFEELWAVSDRFLLPTRRKIPKIPQPKPDLAISFDHSSITNSEMTDFPPELVSCLHPGKTGDERWFPFFFMEAKKLDGSLSHAFQRNLCSASQALFNIFQWMRHSSELEQEFFTDVRVFTMDINNKDATLRMHRAEKGSEAHLQYKFVEVKEIRNYNRIQICHIIKTVLLDYAAAILHPILKRTFQQVAEMGTSIGTGKKRKDYQDELRREGPGRGNSSQDTVMPPQQSHTGLSFPTEVLTTSDVENAPKRSRTRRKDNAADETERSDRRA